MSKNSSSNSAQNSAEKIESQISYTQMSNAIRALSMDAVEKAKSGHPGMPMGMADVATVLFSQFLKFDPKNPNWPDRDRFVLSAGHGSMLIYSLLYLTGYEDMTIEEIKNFRQWGAKTAGHPEYGHATGIETTTGPLGQGITTAVGMALAEKLLEARYPDVTDHYTYVIAGDGCLMEGISQEAISFAGHLKLNKLIVLWDDNNISIDGAVSLASSENQLLRFGAAGWAVRAIDGHDFYAITEALAWAKQQEKPVMIACKTKIGCGAPNKQGTKDCHGSALGEAEILATRVALQWPHEPFVIPEDILDEWRRVGARGKAAFDKWDTRLSVMDAVGRKEFERTINAKIPNLPNLLKDLKKEFAEKKPNMATRNSSQKVLEVLTEALPELLGGSADLTGSVGTKTKALNPITPNDFTGRYIHYGVREHAMQAIMNGISLHKGFIPYGGTFLVFSDYARPAIRLAALMGVRNVFVGTHDSIGLGEDGPTHQPVEHLASLRGIPNLYVLRPADEIEVAECWEIALQAETTPSVISLTRQNVPTLRLEFAENKSAKGAYIISEKKNAKATILATGSEVGIAVEAQKQLEAAGIAVNVVSMPSMELFEKQDAKYKQSVLGNGLRVAVEAGIQQCWDKYLGLDGIFIGMKSFGASAPYQTLYKEFGITAENITAQVKALLKVVENFA